MTHIEAQCRPRILHYSTQSQNHKMLVQIFVCFKCMEAFFNQEKETKLNHIYAKNNNGKPKL